MPVPMALVVAEAIPIHKHMAATRHVAGGPADQTLNAMLTVAYPTKVGQNQ